MALRYFTGFEIGDSTEANATSGSWGMSTAVKRTGAYSLLIDPTTTNAGFWEFRTIGANGTQNLNMNDANTYTTVYFRYATKPASGDEEIMRTETATGVFKGSLRLDSAGNLSQFQADDTSVATGSTVLAQDTWYRLDWRMGTGAGTAAYELLIDGVSEFSGTMTSATNNAVLKLGKSVDKNNNTVQFYYDDLWIDNAAFIGSHAVLGLIPTANGSTMAWTSGTGSSDYQEVDEVPTSGTDYVMSTGNAGDVALFDMQDSATVGITGTIYGVFAFTRNREDTSVTSATNIRIRSGSTNSDNGTSLNGTTTFISLYRFLATDPDTSAAWTTSGVDGVEAGLIENNAVAVRLASVRVQVSFLASAAAGPANLKSYNTNLAANIKSINTNLIANVKSLNTNV